MGTDKAILKLGGRTFVARVAAAMEPLVSELCLIGASDASEHPGLPATPDQLPGRGPLGGILTAIEHANSTDVLVVACDMPLVTTDVLRVLIDAIDADDDAAMPLLARGPLPVCAVYRRRVVAPLRHYLDEGHEKAQGFASRIRTRFVDVDAFRRVDPHGHGLRNINTPQDYADAERLEASTDAT